MQDGGRKMIRTESGGRVPASFRSGRYDAWRARNAADAPDGDEREPHEPGELLVFRGTDTAQRSHHCRGATAVLINNYQFQPFWCGCTSTHDMISVTLKLFCEKASHF